MTVRVVNTPPDAVYTTLSDSLQSTIININIMTYIMGGQTFQTKGRVVDFCTVPPRAAIKVKLPISILYDEVWLCTTGIRSTWGYKLRKIF